MYSLSRACLRALAKSLLSMIFLVRAQISGSSSGFILLINISIMAPFLELLLSETFSLCREAFFYRMR